jgi:hypothetical protein
MNKPLTDAQITNLRSTGVITDHEIAIVEGDLLVAKNVVSEERRILGKASDIINENISTKKILKG